MARYNIYLYLSPLKIILFAILGIAFCSSYGENSFSEYFTKFSDGWKVHRLNYTREENDNDMNVKTPMTSTLFMVSILLIQITASYLCYILAKFVCKVHMQIFSFSFPLAVVGPPLTLGFLFILSKMRFDRTCSLEGFLPNYLFFVEHEIKSFKSYLETEGIWLWVLWWISQSALTYHIWFPDTKVKNLPTEKLFVCPWYCGFLVDQCIIMNRRRAHLVADYQSLNVSMSFFLYRNCVECYFHLYYKFVYKIKSSLAAANQSY